MKIHRVQKGLEETCCFTGHRIMQMPERKAWEKLSDRIWEAVRSGYNHFIVGGAIGFDMMAAEQILMMKDGGNILPIPITLEIAIPCKDHTKKWSKRDKCRLARILEDADVVTHISDEDYKPGCMQKRNQYMVLKSALVIAYYERDATGGTKYTLEQAEKWKRTIWNIADE